jgi:hypothetical protein
MIDIENIIPGNSYACKFRVETMLDTFGRIPGLSDTPLKGIGTYEGIGILMQRDVEQRLVKLKDEKSSKEFVVGFDDIWEIDEIDWVEPLDISE